MVISVFTQSCSQHFALELLLVVVCRIVSQFRCQQIDLVVLSIQILFSGVREFP